MVLSRRANSPSLPRPPSACFKCLRGLFPWQLPIIPSESSFENQEKHFVWQFERSGEYQGERDLILPREVLVPPPRRHRSAVLRVLGTRWLRIRHSWMRDLKQVLVYWTRWGSFQRQSSTSPMIDAFSILHLDLSHHKICRCELEFNVLRAAHCRLGCDAKNLTTFNSNVKA